MWRLLWKEYREKRLWAILLLAALVLPILARWEYLYIGSERGDIWYLLQIPLMLLFGTSTYGHETTGDYVDFLYSRPASWKRILLAKLIVGLVLIAAISVVSVAVCRSAVPARYNSFVALPNLVRSAAFVTMIFAVAYLVGILSSVVLPGVFGGGLTFIGLCALCASSAMVMNYLIPGNFWAMWSMSAWGLGALIAALVIIRFGIALRPFARTVRYIAVVGIVVILMLSTGALFHEQLARRINPGQVEWQSISPDGKYAIVELYDSDEGVGHEWLVDLSHNEKTKLDIASDSELWHIVWIGNNRFVSPATDGVYVVTVKPSGRVESGIIGIDSDPVSKIVVSPGGRYGVLTWPDVIISGYGKVTELAFLDLDARQRYELRILDCHCFWWESATELGYTDTKGGKHIVNILNKPRNVGR